VVSGSIRLLPIRLSNIVILVEDHSGTSLVCRKNQDVRIGLKGAESLALKRG
jgi:hypothetical protein